MFAMGVEAHSAMVLANVVFASESKQSQDLYQLMSGVAETLMQHDTLLVGGHSGEASQMSCGLSVNGFDRPEALMLKAGMRAGDLLSLTQPLGSGVVFAALARRGIASSLQPQNIRIRHAIADDDNLATHEAYPLIFDPQTAGGLLASVDPGQAQFCLQELRELGYEQAQIASGAWSAPRSRIVS